MCELEHLDGIVPGSRVHRRGGLAEGVTRLLAAYEPGDVDVRARRRTGQETCRQSFGAYMRYVHLRLHKRS